MVNAAQYSGSLDACRTILRKEGLAGIYKGYWATLASFGPFSALYFLFYEQFKSTHAKYLASDLTRESSQPLPFVFTLFHGAAAGGIASFLTNGLDMAKLRLQVQRGARAAGAATSAASFQYSVSPRFLSPCTFQRAQECCDSIVCVWPDVSWNAWAQGFADALARIVRSEVLCPANPSWRLAAWLQAFVANRYQMRHLQYVYKGLAGARAAAAFLCELRPAWAACVQTWLMALAALAFHRNDVTCLGMLNSSKGYWHRAPCLSKGFKGLFKGAGARVLFFMPSQAISISSFEYFKSFYADLLSDSPL